jgi:hypothetical protein
MPCAPAWEPPEGKLSIGASGAVEHQPIRGWFGMFASKARIVRRLRFGIATGRYVEVDRVRRSPWQCLRHQLVHLKSSIDVVS